MQPAACRDNCARLAEAMRRAAGYSAEPSQAAPQRADLSRALASNMKASLLGSDGDSLGIDATLSGAERKADFEATKAAMRKEHDRARGL